MYLLHFLFIKVCSCGKQVAAEKPTSEAKAESFKYALLFMIQEDVIVIVLRSNSKT